MLRQVARTAQRSGPWRRKDRPQRPYHRLRCHNARGRSALHGAAHIRSDVIVQLRFDHGAELDVVDDRGITPLMIAEGGGHILLPGLGGGSTAELLKGLGSASFDPAAMIEHYNEGRIR